jgi:translocation and assembly module TamB
VAAQTRPASSSARAQPPKGRWPLRILRGVARTFAGLLAVVLALTAAAIIAVNLPWGRRLAVRELNTALSTMFKGHIVVEKVGRLGLYGAGGLYAHVTAPDGTVVLVAQDASARITPFALLRSFLRHHGDLQIEVFDVDVRSLEVNLDTDAAGVLKLQSAFDPAQSPPTKPPPPGRPLLLEFPSVTVRRGWVHGQMKGAPLIDADLDDLLASIRVPPSRLTIDVPHVNLRTRSMPRGADANARVQVRLEMPSKAGADLGVSGALDGDIGGIPTTAHASFDGENLEAVLDVPEVSADKIRALAPRLALTAAARAHVEAHGSLAALAVTAHLAAGRARFDANGNVAVTGTKSATLRIDARHIDLRAFSPTASTSDLNASLDVRARIDADGLFCGDYGVAIAPGVVGTQSVPAAKLRGDFQQVEQGFRVDIASSVIAFPPDLGTGGHGALQASATIMLVDPPSLEGSAHVALEGLDRPGLRVDAAQVDARASGRLADPQLSATLAASGLRVGGYSFLRASAEVAGTPSRARVSASLLGERNSVSAQARATVDVAGPLRAEGAEIDLRRGSRALHAHVDRLAVAGGTVDVEGALVEGIGAPTRATVHLRPGSLVVQSDSNGIDLGTLGYLLGAEKTLRKGRVSYIVDLAAVPARLSGTAVVDMDNACFADIDGLTGHIDTRMQGRAVRGTVQLRADGIGSINVDPMNVELAGAEPLERSSWRRASGEMTLTGDLDLEKLIDLLPPNTSPLASASGKLTLSGHITRKAASEAIPDITLNLRTTGLRFATRGAPDVTNGRTILVATPKTAESGIDVAMELEANGSASSGKITVSLIDKHGTVVSIAAASTAIPYAELASSSTAFAERMLRAPFTAKVAMPARSMDRLPDMLRLDGATGTADFTMSIEGTALDPRVTVQGGMHSLRLVGYKSAVPIEAQLAGKYDGITGDATVRVTSATAGGAKEELLEAVAHVNAKIADIIERRTANWDASASAKLKDFPLSMLAPLSDRRVHGTANGQLELTGLHRDARAKMDLDVTDLRVAKQKYGQIRLASTYDGHVIDADLHFDEGPGIADAKASMALKWGAQLLPSPDPSGSTHASLTARKLRVGFVAPFIQSAADALDGTLDADAHVNLNPGQKPEMSGTVSLSDGIVGLAALGQELHAVTAHVVFTPDGVVRLQDASASATAGKVTAVGVARLAGTALVGAEVDLQILKRDAMPLDVEGSDLGSVYGKLVVKMSTSADREATTLSVDVPSLNVRLPDASTHSVQDLGDPPDHDYIGTFAAPGRFVALPMDGHQVAQAAGNEPAGSSLTVKVHIGDAQIARGTDVRVDLTGNLVAKVEKKTTVTGQITIRHGKLDVQGKSFAIEPGGTVTFTSDPADPEVKVTAGWTAEDGTRVLADYVGPLKTGKVTLRSEPARPQNEIVALIAFGTADGSESTPYQPSSPTDPGVQAGTAVGGFATAGLSKGLDKLTGLDITAKIDTSQPNPRPEVEVQIARNISLELSVVLGTPPPGTNEDTTYATIDWRFHKRWSLETTFGDAGSSIADVLWRRRY